MARVDSLSLRTWCISMFSAVSQTEQVLFSTALDRKVLFANFFQAGQGVHVGKLGDVESFRFS